MEYYSFICYDTFIYKLLILIIMKKEYRVTLELDVCGDSPEDAVKRAINIIVEDNSVLIYIVQDAETNKIYSVDQSEETFPSIEIVDYQPNITTNIEL